MQGKSHLKTIFWKNHFQESSHLHIFFFHISWCFPCLRISPRKSLEKPIPTFPQNPTPVVPGVGLEASPFVKHQRNKLRYVYIKWIYMYVYIYTYIYIWTRMLCLYNAVYFKTYTIRYIYIYFFLIIGWYNNIIPSKGTSAICLRNCTICWELIMTINRSTWHLHGSKMILLLSILLLSKWKICWRPTASQQHWKILGAIGYIWLYLLVIATSSIGAAACKQLGVCTRFPWGHCTLML